MTTAPARPQKSTNVRSLERLARGTLSALGAVSPPLAGELALRLFTNTRRGRPREGERDVLATARRFVVPFDGESLVAWSWGRGEKTVLLAHGWNGRATQLHGFVRPLLDAGFRVVAFDSVGHGQSTGTQATIVDFARALTAVAQASGGLHAIVAHSMGGAAATIAIHEGLEVERAVFIASPVDPGVWIRHFTSLLDLGPDVSARFQEALVRRTGRRPDELHAARLAPALDTALLAIHDTSDREVPFEAAITLTRAWPHAELHETSGLGHQRILSDPDVIARSVRFVAEPHVHQGAAA